MSIKALFLSSFFVLFTTASMADSKVLSAVTKKVDLDRYIGSWYEIARFPNKHQKDCVKTRAEYSYNEKKDGLIIINRCSLSDGSEKQITGIARVDDADTYAKLKVNFVPAWLRWTGIGWGNYWIIEIDPDYKFAVVSEPKREYLWILSRTPSMSKATFDGIVDRLKENGFNTANLIISSTIE